MESNYALPIHLEIAGYENGKWMTEDQMGTQAPRTAIIESRDIRPYWQDYGLGLSDQEDGRCDLGGLVQRAVTDIDPYYYRGGSRVLLDRISQYAESMDNAKRCFMQLYYGNEQSSLHPYMNATRNLRSKTKSWVYQPRRFRWFERSCQEADPYCLSSWVRDWWDCRNPGRWGSDPILQKISLAVFLDGNVAKPSD